VSATYTRSFLVELLTATHDFSADTLKCALFDGTTMLDSLTTVYSAADGELASGSGYVAGGNTIAVSTGFPKFEAGGAVRFESTTWPFTNQFRVKYALIYNASKANRSVLVIDLGRGTYSGQFTISFPATVAPTIFLAGTA
jgi:hypothetical protein